MKDLIENLKEFNKARNNVKPFDGLNEDDFSVAIADCFEPCAKYVLCKGYFWVNEQYIIDIGAIELYYHEEDGKFKDHIMYHTNEQLSMKIKSIIDNPDRHPNDFNVIIENKGYPYMETGSFNLHPSGVDVTFENNDNSNDKYRASFLIRSYRVLKSNNGEYPKNNDTKYDNCSTHIFDDLFYEGILFGTTKIEWIECEETNKVFDQKKYPRKNVAKYIAHNVKDDTIEEGCRCIIDKDYNAEIEKKKNDSTYIPKYIKIEKKYYKQDMKLWQFRIEGLPDI